MDMMQEFKSETSNYNAEFSKTGGVVLNLTSKSGTNEVHGSAFEFLQNRVLGSLSAIIFYPCPGQAWRHSSAVIKFQQSCRSRARQKPFRCPHSAVASRITLS